MGVWAGGAEAAGGEERGEMTTELREAAEGGSGYGVRQRSCNAQNVRADLHVGDAGGVPLPETPEWADSSEYDSERTAARGVQLPTRDK